MYAVPEQAILEANRIDSRWGILPGMYLFIPGAKPRTLTEAMRSHYSRRALFRSPLSGRYTSFVGMRRHPVLGFSKFHNGVDIACPMRTWVGACAEGTVIAAGWGGAIGKYVKVDHHNGYQTVYGHLDQILVRQGQNVKRGQLIARSGNTGRTTGPHLHFTIYAQGRVVDPLDFLW
jgi:murein DD-endopeptidase MepM/ murein hydrolase activator NlpD